MAKRLILGWGVVAGLVSVALWPQSPVAASSSRPPADSPVQPAAALRAKKAPRMEIHLEEGTATIEEDLTENGVIKTILVTVSIKTLRERYVWYHQRIAEKLTAEQLAEKCNALRKERIGLSAEGEIEELQKQLDQLKRKHQDDKGISTRIQSAIEALKRQPSVESNSP